MAQLTRKSNRSERQHPKLYELFVRQLSDRAMFLLDTEGCIESWNRGVENLLGYSETEWVGQLGTILFTPEDRANEEAQKEMQRALRDGQTADVRWHVKKDGSRLFVDGLMLALKDSDGHLLGFAKVMRDATEHQLAEENLRARQERLTLAEHGANVGVWDWDIRTSKVTRSDVHYRLFGKEPRSEPEMYSEWLQQIDPQDHALVEEKTRQALRTGDLDCEFRAIWPDGTARWLHAKGKVYFENGAPIRMVRMVRDVTAQKQAEEALRESEARKGAILSASLDAILIMDGKGCVREFNTAAEQMFGYKREEAIGRLLADLVVPPRLREAHHNGLSRYLATGEAVVLGRRIEISGMRADGSEFPVELAIVKVPTGGVPLFAGYVRDITERKRSEAELQRSNQDLERFAQLVAHDLQSPLHTVRVCAELLADRYQDKLDETAKEFVALVLNGSQSMEQLIRGLLEHAHFGSKEAKLQPVHLGEVVTAVLAALTASIEESEAEVMYGELPSVEGDSVQLQQLFQNLITNAIKYHGRERPHITIGADIRQGECRVWVGDNGEGIEPEYSEQIFDPLKRLHGRDVPGTGLGLAVCKRIVERHGGRIWVESQLGQGSTFFFTLPSKVCSTRP
ncbi:MAG: PAS domain-containing sensor histidine kinase [Bryobacteraceae bacterium]